MNKTSGIGNEDEQIKLPPGFRFHPTDEELITHYLSTKVLDSSFCAIAVAEVDLNKCEPWDLPWKAKIGEKEWYFFCVRDRKYPTGLRTNRATDAGYWKATGKDKEIYRGKTLVGMKKTLVFYKGRAPRGEKTNWVMHEYRLEGKYSTYNLPKTAKNEWVICRIFQKSSGGKRTHISGLLRSSSFKNQPCPSQLPSLMNSSSPYKGKMGDDVTEKSLHVTCFSNQVESHKTLEEMIDNLYPADISSSSSSLLYSKIPLLNPFYSSQIPDSALIQHQSALRILLENNGSIIRRNSKAEFSQETALSADMNNDISSVSNHDMVDKSFEDQDDPSTSAGPIDLDCLWNY